MSTQKKERAAARTTAQDAGKNTDRVKTHSNLPPENEACQEEDLFLDFVNDDVVIFGEQADDLDAPNETFYFVIESKSKPLTLGVTLNHDQVSILKKILLNYVEAFEAYRGLKKRYDVKAIRGDGEETA